MVGLGAQEIILLLFCFGVPVLVVGIVFVVIRLNAKNNNQSNRDDSD